MSGKKLSLVLFAVIVMSLAVAGCGGGGDGTAVVVTSPTTGLVINASGGSGSTTSGGGGGELSMSNAGPDGIKVMASGTVDASFIPTDSPLCDTGLNPYTTPAGTATVAIDVVNATIGEPPAGTPYMVVGDQNVYMSDGDTFLAELAETVTGIEVSSGVTLIMGLNFSVSNATGMDTAQIVLSGDLCVSGAVMTNSLTSSIEGTTDSRHNSPATGRDKGRLDITANKAVLSGGSIDTSGGDAIDTDTRGGDGGEISIITTSGVSLLSGSTIDASGGNGLGTGVAAVGGLAGASDNDLTTGIGIATLGGAGAITNYGTITANGGSGTTGGDGAFIILMADQNLYNTGAVSSNGGLGSTGPGGIGDGIDLVSNLANVRNSGGLSANGGNGTGGGVAGAIILEVELTSSGDVLNSGTITARGGNGLTGSGGEQGGVIIFSGYTGPVKNTGALNADGGSGTGGTGGDGGSIQISNGNLASNAAGAIQLYAEMSVAGGSGTTGGAGGSVTISQTDDLEGDATADGIELYGYGTANVSGGSGVTLGGSGTFFSATIGSGGSVTNEADIISLGGSASDATVGLAGSGGYVDLNAGADVTNSGDIVATGGISPVTAGSAIGVSITANNKVTNSGGIYSNGGNVTDAVGTSGNGGIVTLTSTAPPTVWASTPIITVAKGSGGDIAGTNGTIIIDGFDNTGADGILP